MTAGRGEVEIEGVRHPGLIFRISTEGVPGARLGQIVTSVVLLVLGLVSIIFLVTAGPRTDVVAMVGRVVWILGAVFFFGLLVVLVISWRTSTSVALVADGIYSKTALGQMLIPWATITATGERTFGGVRYFGVRTSSPPRLSRVARLFRPLNRKVGGWDYSYPLSLMNDADEFKRVIERCLQDPSERSLIG
jgi:hypothetical protein